MGLFNTLLDHTEACPFCGCVQVWNVQFKYANCWQYEYRIGDTLKWGGNESGINTNGKVVIEGIAENDCLNCHAEEVYAEIFVEENKLKSVRLLSSPLPLEENYLS